MRAVLLATSIFGLFWVAHIVYSHVVSVARKERVLVVLMLAACIAYVALFPALGVAPTDDSSSQLTAFVAGGCAIGFLALGYIEFWSLIERSFSLRILIDAADTGERGATRDELAKTYGGGRGLAWMMSKRLEGLVGAGLLEPFGATFRLTSRGLQIAAACQWLEWLFGFGDDR